MQQIVDESNKLLTAASSASSAPTPDLREAASPQKRLALQAILLEANSFPSGGVRVQSARGHGIIG
jgi:hypothetical protein